jgi:hypothetical protein
MTKIKKKTPTLIKFLMKKQNESGTGLTDEKAE